MLTTEAQLRAPHANLLLSGLTTKFSRAERSDEARGAQFGVGCNAVLAIQKLLVCLWVEPFPRLRVEERKAVSVAKLRCVLERLKNSLFRTLPGRHRE